MPETIDIVFPKEQQEGLEATVGHWLKKCGDPVALYEPIAEISTNKVAVEITAPATGVLAEIFKKQNEHVAPGELLGRIQVGAAGASIPQTTPITKAPEKIASTESDQPLSPAVRRLLNEHHLQASQIKGTGREGRITYEDVTHFIESQKQTPASAPKIGAIPSKKVPHSNMRRSIATHMVQSILRTAPHVTAVFDADLSAVLAHRSKHKGEFEKKGVKLTLTTYFISAAIKALQAVPEINSRWHEDALEIFEDYNIGIATALEKDGLIVPVIHKAQKLDLLGIATRLQELTAKARNNTLKPEDVQNGTFTITNHGVSGSLIATPIINQPQSAILGIGKLEKRVVVVEENGKETMQIKPMAYVTLTIDHRGLDGFQANAFLTKFVDALKNWS